MVSYVAALKPLGAGESVGYGRGFTATAATRVATVPIGYGDGLDRDLGGRWSVMVGGATYPLVGRVSMDAFSFEAPPWSPVGIGDEVVILGDALTAEAMATRLGTIGYEVTTRLGPRVPRVVIPVGG